MPIATEDITAVILAGGRGRRMGGEDKGLVEFNGQPLVERVIEAVRPWVGKVIINANRNLDRYRSYADTVICDQLADYQGPLAGFAAAMAAANTPNIITLPCDSPQLPDDYVTRMCQAFESQQGELCVAHDGRRLQPVHALLPVSLLPSLMSFLAGGDRKIDLWYGHHRMAIADFSQCASAFLNINTPVDQRKLEAGDSGP